MFEIHKHILTPKDDAIIWRYMDLAKFLDILQRESLFFPTAALFDDPFEGSYPVQLIEDRPRYFQGVSKPTVDQMPECIQKMKKWHYINCWHMNNYESAAMWKLYDKSGSGIAIVSTIGRLKRSIQDDTNRTYIGEVSYIDYETESFDPSNMMYPFFHKRNSFRHEAEIRALILKYPPDFTGALSEFLEFQGEVPDGISVFTNIRSLIKEIRVSPESPVWLYKLVQDLVTQRFGLDFDVNRSDLLKDPLF